MVGVTLGSASEPSPPAWSPFEDSCFSEAQGCYEQSEARRWVKKPKEINCIFTVRHILPE